MQLVLENALTVDRLQFAFTVTFHYIFPQLTMGPVSYTHLDVYKRQVLL